MGFDYDLWNFPGRPRTETQFVWDLLHSTHPVAECKTPGGFTPQEHCATCREVYMEWLNIQEKHAQKDA